MYNFKKESQGGATAAYQDKATHDVASLQSSQAHPTTNGADCLKVHLLAVVNSSEYLGALPSAQRTTTAA